MNILYEMLCNRIREKCQHDGWYGPELRTLRYALLVEMIRDA